VKTKNAYASENRVRRKALNPWRSKTGADTQHCDTHPTMRITDRLPKCILYSAVMAVKSSKLGLKCETHATIQHLSLEKNVFSSAAPIRP
jgi:hypothetical protein